MYQKFDIYTKSSNKASEGYIYPVKRYGVTFNNPEMLNYINLKQCFQNCFDFVK